jgi:hypothetical protein
MCWKHSSSGGPGAIGERATGEPEASARSEGGRDRLIGDVALDTKLSSRARVRPCRLLGSHGHTGLVIRRSGKPMQQPRFAPVYSLHAELEAFAVAGARHLSDQ